MRDNIFEAFNWPIEKRCEKLPELLNQCTSYEIKWVFPELVYSIFGSRTNNFGWGLRATTKKISPLEFDSLMAFFVPSGPLIALCNVLLCDSIRYNVNLNKYSFDSARTTKMFPNNVMYTSSNQGNITSLCLNSFEFFMAHFVLHATVPLHKKYPHKIQNNGEKTVYFHLSACYLAHYLPIDTDMRLNETYLPYRASQWSTSLPHRKLRCLRIPQNSLYAYNKPLNTLQTMYMNNTKHWRIESVLHLFCDIWLHYNANTNWDLPDIEFLRVVQILIKQIHAFANMALFDLTDLALLRKLAHTQLQGHVFNLMMNLLDRWPLDDTFSQVLEIWFCYLQPWHYTYCVRNNPHICTIDIGNHFDEFIVNNLVIYTQIFPRIISRCMRLDLTSNANVRMLERMAQLFYQPELCNKIWRAEQYVIGNPYFNTCQLFQFMEFDENCIRSLAATKQYKPMFSNESKCLIQQMIRVCLLARQKLFQTKTPHQTERDDNVLVSFKRFIREFVHKTSYKKMQSAYHKAVKMEHAMRLLAAAFDFPFPEELMAQIQPREQVRKQSRITSKNLPDFNQMTSKQMHTNLSNVINTVDPVVSIVGSNECRILVKILNKIATNINEKVGEDTMNMLWNRTDFIGTISRFILLPPITTKTFEKYVGFTVLCEKKLPPRISLRPLGSLSFWVGTFVFLCLCYCASKSFIITLALITLLFIMGFVFA